MRRTKYLQIIAALLVYLVTNISIVHALAINHNPSTDVTASQAEATITWTTDAAADSRVDYGASSSLGNSESSSALTTDHSVMLTGLGAATTYYYRLASTTAGETATADNSGSLYSFATGGSTDTAPPQFNVTLPEYYNRNQITFGGFTDPDSVLRLYVNSNQADIGTDKYTQLATSDASGHFIFKYVNLAQQENKIVIWARDRGGNINTASYTVKVDTTRPEVTLSNIPSIAASTSLTINGTVSEDVTATYSVNNDTRSEEIKAGQFSSQLTLQDSTANNVDMQFSDKAGNVFEKEFVVNVDAEGPVLHWNNLGALNPSYIQEVEVEGNVSKPGAYVMVFVNNKTYSSEAWSTSIRDMLVHYGTILAEGDKEYVSRADSSGHFKIKVFLTQEFVTEKTEYQYAPYETSPAYNQGSPGGGPTAYGTSRTATGRVVTGPTGRYANAWDNRIQIVVFDELGRSQKADGIITFARCGYGADWNIEVKNPTPSVIIPEHLKKGIAQIAFEVKMTWQGVGQKQKMLRDPILTQYKLSEEMKKDYKFDPNQLMGGIHPVWNNDCTRGYVVLELNKKDYEQQNLSKMKKEDLLLKLPMQIELEYQYDDGSGIPQTAIQKQCWDVSTVLDVRIPPSVIPKELLNASVQFINNTIKAIDKILKPLKTITIVVFVTCLLTWVMYFFALMKKAYDCMDSKEGKKSDSCLEAERHTKDVEKYMHYVCDRIFCPTVPTADVFFADNPGLPDNPDAKCALEPGTNKEEGCGKAYMDKWDSACLLMDELKRSKCLRYEAGATQFAQSCGGVTKTAFYGVADFCSKKDEQTTNRVSIKKGDKVEEYIIDKDGQARKITSQITVEQAQQLEGKGGVYGSVTVGQGASQTTYATEPVLEYSKNGKQVDVKYDSEGKLYYGTDNAKTYLCQDAKDKVLELTKDRNGNLVSAGGDCKTKNQPSTLPPDLIKGMNLPGARKYVVDPTDNLLTALQCVCLPAINGFLIMWKNMLGAIMQCFQSILITGDGKSGLCREVLTVYVCDVIFNAIRCFVNRYGAGYGKGTEPQMGISKFFKSAATAGKDVQDSITGRYGKSSLYKTMFSEKKLIHAACLWAFTGDFDFDIGSALTAPGAISLKSKSFIYPATRRFISSNPLTGYTTHIYNIGAGLVAGANIGYKLQLVCSSDFTCSVNEGFVNGQCDCYKQSQEQFRDITNTFGPGRLMAGEMLGPNEGDIYVKIENERWRYDKVRLIYWEEGKPQEIKEFKITPIGGNPPADCSFDLASGDFKCAFEIGDEGYAIFSEKPTPEKDLYKLGEVMKLKFKVDKRSPQAAKDASTYTSNEPIPFYLKYIVVMPNGLVLPTTKDKYYPYVADGLHDPPANIPWPTVSKELLMGLVPSATGGHDVLIYKAPGAERTLVGASVEAAEAQTVDNFAVYVKQRSQNGNNKDVEVKLCIGVLGKGANNQVDVFYYQEYGLNTPNSDRMCSNPITPTVENKPGSAPTSGSIMISYKGVKITVPYSSIDEKLASAVIIYKAAQAITAAGNCETRFTTATPGVFTVKIGLYPCKKRDESQPYSSNNCELNPTAVNYFGEVQEYDVPMRAICSDAGAVVSQCPPDKKTGGECECGDPNNRKKVANCGQDDDHNYCFVGIKDYSCIKYTSCLPSTKEKQIKISSSNYGTGITKKQIYGERGTAEDNEVLYYCDCDGNFNMNKDNCNNKYCYNGKDGWGCYENPPTN